MRSSQKTIAQMTDEVRANNIEKGWRLAEGGPGDNTLGDYLALLHSEVAESLEAYRDHRLNDATRQPEPLYVDGIDLAAGRLPKPEGVGSELADVLIRLLDTGDVFGIPVFDADFELADVVPLDSPRWAKTFGDDMAWLHQLIAAVPAQRELIVPGAWFPALPQILRGLVAVAERYDIDLTAEYERKVAYNSTRSFQHGGRTLAATATRPNVSEVRP